ncbi:hypothetical protein M413DRAFT_241140 [Hebeloma cylindrosporum]|uniref:Uncharacterized protein n=1 Tax=Hebeloma cylindrosporum TaxID=76867 RepID=A0A0C3BQ13_HEBCY|nr:hypothetical protein M413DRAFT_241140 [Hebeloma cylindrosporum h7]
MPTSFQVNDHPSEPYDKDHGLTSGVKALLTDQLAQLRGATKDIHNIQLIQSSLTNEEFSKGGVRREPNGFVHTALRAYNYHHHLILRPDDIWIAILGQLNLYINNHSEDLRHVFVAHEGQKKLRVQMGGADDFGDIALLLAEKIEENIHNPAFKKWALPDFTTTTRIDTAICAITLMSTLKSYFKYECSRCGVPQVTLEGERSDYENILRRLEELPTFGLGEEPNAWVALLRPIIKKFIAAFDGNPDATFWNRIAHIDDLKRSGGPILSGWITAFCVWDTDGIWQGPPMPKHHPADQKYLDIAESFTYGILRYDEIPGGFCQVDLRVLDGRPNADCIMVAGHMGTVVEGNRSDTVRPLSAWYIYENPEQTSEKGTIRMRQPCEPHCADVD